jgi:ADP-ribosyl-[dinitrogen reductase] hydrolase
MIGGGPFRLSPGEFTDDTSTALLLGESLLAKRGFYSRDQLDRYYDWYQNGHLGSTGVCFDIGIGTRTAVLAYKKTGDSYPTSKDDTRAGNGSLMRLAPVVLAYHNQPLDLIRLASLSSRTTHGAQSCLDACQFYAALIAGCLKGVEKSALLDPKFYNNYGRLDEFCPEILAVVEGSYKSKSPPAIIGGGYVVHALEAALWAFATTESFKDGVLAVANLGDDADTTSAIFGQLAGAYYGEDAIPLDWREKLAFYPFIVTMADELFSVAENFGFAVTEDTSTDHRLSERYESIHACLTALEREYAHIKRRIEPGPKRFKTLSELDEAVEVFKSTYRATSPECDHQMVLLERDYLVRIIGRKRTELEQQLAKPKIALPFGLHKA